MRFLFTKFRLFRKNRCGIISAYTLFLGKKYDSIVTVFVDPDFDIFQVASTISAVYISTLWLIQQK